MINLRKDFKIQDIRLINFVSLTNREKEMVRNWRNNEQVKRWMYSDHLISGKEHSGFMKKLLKDNKNFYWVVKNKKEQYLGIIYLNRIDSKNKNAYLGIYSNPHIKLLGIGSLLMKCLKKLAFNKAGLHSLKLEVIYTNRQAIRFYKKFSFIKEGLLKEFIYKNGKWQDVVIMGFIKQVN